jgi:tRNA 2-thiouridine synthesizing protein B
MTIYLMDEPYADVGLSYAANDPEARVVLVQDAVYLARGGGLKGRVYAIADDVSRRGIGGSIDSGVGLIGYDELVKMMEAERVVCFL